MSSDTEVVLMDRQYNHCQKNAQTLNREMYHIQRRSPWRKRLLAVVVAAGLFSVKGSCNDNTCNVNYGGQAVYAHDKK